jgi:hypothetical protein
MIKSAGDRFQILCLDGGGLKGIFAAAILAAIEEDLNTTAIDHFDLIAGTSTGGILAIGLGLGLRPREILDFYVNEGKTIFSDRFRKASLRQYGTNKFPAAPLATALKKHFKEKRFGADGKPYPFRSHLNRENAGIGPFWRVSENRALVGRLAGGGDRQSNSRPFLSSVDFNSATLFCKGSFFKISRLRRKGLLPRPVERTARF